MVTGKAMGLGPGGPRVPAEMEAASPSQPSEDDEKQVRRLEKMRLAVEQNLLGQPFHLVKGTLTAWDGDMPRDARASWGRRFFP